MGESDGQNTRGKILFWFSLQGGSGGPKGVFLVHYVDRTLKVNFCFGLSLQSGSGGPKKFYSFHLHHGYATCTKN